MSSNDPSATTKEGNTVRLTLHGLASEGGHVRFTDFLNELQLLGGALKRFDRFVSGGRLSSYYRVVDLSHSSPATIVLEGQPKKRDGIFHTEEVVGSFLATVRHIREQGELPQPLDFGILGRLLKMAEPSGRTIGRVEIGQNGSGVPLDATFTEIVTRAMAPEEEYPGEYSGMLEAINLHGGANIFYLYPDIGSTKLVCHFSKAQEESAIRGVKHFVRIRGMLRRKTNAPYPYSALIDSLEIMPSDSELPDFWDLRGIAPGLTGNQSSEDFVREIRDAINV
jgi:hypothetical protein